MSDSRSMLYMTVTPYPQSQQDNRAVIEIDKGVGKGTVTIGTQQEVQVSSIQLLIPSSEEFVFGDAQVTKGVAASRQSDVAASKIEQPSEDEEVIAYHLLEYGVGDSPDGMLVKIEWSRQQADKDVAMTLVVDACFKSGESLRRIHVHYSLP